MIFRTLSWQNEESSKVIRNKASLPDSKKTAKPFFNGLFTSAGRSPYVRFILVHDEAPEKITKENVMIALEKADMSLTREPVQAKEVVKVGWLLGSHLGAFNHDVWLEVFSGIPQLNGTQVDFRYEPIRLDNLKAFDSNTVRAVHVYAAKKDLSAVRITFLKMYSKKSKALPLGTRFRFIPDTMNLKIPLTRKAAKMASRGKLKQKNFLAETSVTTSEDIIGLDQTQCGVSLRQALTAMRSKRQPDVNLFVGIEETNEGSVNFVYKTALSKFRIVSESSLMP